MKDEQISILDASGKTIEGAMLACCGEAVGIKFSDGSVSFILASSGGVIVDPDIDLEQFCDRDIRTLFGVERLIDIKLESMLSGMPADNSAGRIQLEREIYAFLKAKYEARP